MEPLTRIFELPSNSPESIQRLKILVEIFEEMGTQEVKAALEYLERMFYVDRT